LTIEASRAANPVCSPAMAPAQCAEAQIAEIGRIFGDYKTEIARLEDELSTARSDIATLKDKVAGLQSLTATIDSETKPVIPKALLADSRGIPESGRC